VTDFEDDSPGGGATSALEIDAGEEVQRGLSTRIQQRQHWLSSLEDRDTEVPQAKSSTVRVQARLPQFLDEGEGGPLEDKTTFHLPMKAKPWKNMSASSDVAAGGGATLPPGGFVPLRDPADVFTEELRRWNARLKYTDEGSEGVPAWGKSRVTWCR